MVDVRTLSWRVILFSGLNVVYTACKLSRSLSVKNQMTVARRRTPIESMMRSQFRITRPIVTWFLCTMAPIEKAKVTSRDIPKTVPAERGTVQETRQLEKESRGKFTTCQFMCAEDHVH